MSRTKSPRYCYAITVKGRHCGTYVSTTPAGAIAAFKRVVAKVPNTWVPKDAKPVAQQLTPLPDVLA